MEKPDLSLFRYIREKTKESAEYILSKSSTTIDFGLTGTEILKQFEEEFPSDKINRYSYTQYLSDLSKDEISRIASGPKGYYLLDQSQFQSLGSDLAENIEKFEPKRVEREKLLYPKLVTWLVESKQYSAEDTHQKKSDLGKWGNPDITGIRVVQNVGGKNIEIVTIEAKMDLSMWATDFFQAVSHKRFANRAYFAFAQKKSLVSKVPQELQYYHEIFGVGVIVISIEDDHFDEIRDSTQPPSLVPEKAEIRELFPAPYNIALPIFQKRYLDALEIIDDESLFKFGRGNI